MLFFSTTLSPYCRRVYSWGMDCLNCHTVTVSNDRVLSIGNDDDAYCEDCISGVYVVECEHCEHAGLREEYFTVSGNECHSCVAEIDMEMAADELRLARNDGMNQMVPVSDAQNDYEAASARLWAAESKTSR